MKRFLLVAITLLLHFCMNAQDTILKRDGSKILSKILEISGTEVKYKKFGLPDGPDFIEDKSNIQSIRYINGSKDEFEIQPAKNTPKQRETNVNQYSQQVYTDNTIEIRGRKFQYHGNQLNDKELHRVLLNKDDPRIEALVKKARTSKGLQYVGFAGIPVGGFGLGAVVLSAFLKGQEATDVLTFGAVCCAVAVTFPISTLHFYNKRRAYNEEAIELYNTK